MKGFDRHRDGFLHPKRSTVRQADHPRPSGCTGGGYFLLFPLHMLPCANTIDMIHFFFFFSFLECLLSRGLYTKNRGNAAESASNSRVTVVREENYLACT